MSELLKHFTKVDSPDRAVEALLEDGAIMVENVIPPDEVAELNKKFQPTLDEERLAQVGRDDRAGSAAPAGFRRVQLRAGTRLQPVTHQILQDYRRKRARVNLSGALNGQAIGPSRVH
jgi:hypothetical protein